MPTKSSSSASAPKRLGIIGSGDLGQLIAYHAAQSKKFIVAGFFDDTKATGDIVCGNKILGGSKDIEACANSAIVDELILAIGYKHFETRKKLFLSLKERVKFANVIHPSSYIDDSCRLGEGIVILPGCTLDRNVELADNVLLNTGCVIAHDSKVNAHSFLSPAVAMAGFSSVGECCNIGINTTIIDNIRISDNIQTGGATVVIRDLAEPGLYVGNPARFVK